MSKSKCLIFPHSLNAVTAIKVYPAVHAGKPGVVLNFAISLPIQALLIPVPKYLPNPSAAVYSQNATDWSKPPACPTGRPSVHPCQLPPHLNPEQPERTKATGLMCPPFTIWLQGPPTLEFLLCWRCSGFFHDLDSLHRTVSLEMLPPPSPPGTLLSFGDQLRDDFHGDASPQPYYYTQPKYPISLSGPAPLSLILHLDDPLGLSPHLACMFHEDRGGVDALRDCLLHAWHMLGSILSEKASERRCWT